MKLKKGDKVQITAIALESNASCKWNFLGDYDTIKEVTENKKYPYQLEDHFWLYNDEELTKVD